MEFSSDTFMLGMHYLMAMLLLAGSVYCSCKVLWYVQQSNADYVNVGSILTSVMWTMTALAWHLL